jgi:hypothetical protein
MYSELQGAFGSDAYYRPKRHRVRDLLSPFANAQLRTNGKEYPVLDLSSNGLALLVQRDESLQVGATVDGKLILHGIEAQAIRARVVRAETGPRGVRIALGLTGGYLDLEAARRIDARAQLDHSLQTGPFGRHSLVPAALREVIGEAVHLVQFYRQCLEPYEAEARASGEAAVIELAARAYEGLAPMFAQLRERASRAAEPCMHDPNALAAAKLYTETVLTPLLLSAPMIARAYEKPLGYPGDYQVMLYYYADAFEGDTAFAKLFHRLFVQHPLSAGACTRKDYVADCLKRELLRHNASATSEFAVTSLGCGPAKEVAAFIDSVQSWSVPIRLRMIDQEPETLEVAHQGAQRALASTSSHGVVECLNLSFGQLLKNPKLLEKGGPQQFIYSTGLFDYLPTPTAQQLIATLYACLTPGGQLLIANAKGPNEYFFCPEFVLDWSLIYRSRDEMEELARVLPGDATFEVELEAGGAYWFLKVRRAG